MIQTGELGRVFEAGEVIFQQGEVGERMYVVQEGQVEVIVEQDGREVRLAVLGEGDFFGEMAIFEREVRSATVRALTRVRAITVDKKGFLSRIHQDPALAYRIVQTMSSRIRRLNDKVARRNSEAG